MKTRYEKFMSLPRWIRILIASILFVPSVIAAQPEIIREVYDEWKGLCR